MLASVIRLAQQLVQRATVALVNSALAMQGLQLVVGAGEVDDGQDGTGVEHFEPYGFTSAPFPATSEAIVLRVGGAADHPVAIVVADRTTRPKTAAPGDVILYHADQLSSIRLTAGGTVIVTGVTVQITAPAVTVTSSQIQLGAPTLAPPLDGVLTGLTVDPFTGATFAALGGASAIVTARKI